LGVCMHACIYYWGSEMKGDEMGRIFSTNGEDKK
jgi:hypothetical protein